MPFEIFKRKPEVPAAPKPVSDIVIRFLKLTDEYALNALNDLETDRTYPVEVDYSLSLEKLILAGNYDDVARMVDSKNYPTLRTGKVWTPIKIIRFTDNVYKPAGILRGLGLENVDAQTLISLGNQYPDLQRQFTIAAYGQTAWDTFKEVVVLSGDQSKRYVGHIPTLDWAGEFPCVAVRPTWQSIVR